MRMNTHAVRMFGPAITAAALAFSAPAGAADTPAEAANKQLVLDFYAALDDADATHTTKQRIQGIAEKYLSPDYKQNSEIWKGMPGPGTPREKLVHMFQSMPERPAPAKPKTEAVMAEGDRVMLLTSRTTPDAATGTPRTAYIFNMFRVKDGKLVEHWDAAPVPAAGAPGP